MTGDELKKLITDKFGTMARFCRIIGHQLYDMQLLIHRANRGNDMEDARRIRDLVKKTSAEQEDPKLVSHVERAKLKKAIEKAGGVDLFVKENKGYIGSSVYKIITGNRKVRTKKVQALLDHFGIKF